jgi:hypothetical protein
VTKSKQRPGVGEFVVPLLLASVPAAIAGIIGFVGGIFLCARFLKGESTEWALVAGPLLAVIAGGTVYVLAFSWLFRYGNAPPDDN